MPDRNGGHLDLSACDREPIHTPGSIQPHGLLFALDDKHRIISAAGDCYRLLRQPGDPLGRRISELLDTAGLEFAGNEQQADFVGTVSTGGGLDVFVHRSHNELVLELEPAPAERRTGAQVLKQLLPIVSGIAAAVDLRAACQLAVEGVRRITGYDRVMIYRFLEDESGQVIAEARSGDMASFRNHRYPASDIPRQARALYVRNPIRVIADVGYRPAPIIGGEGPLDLSGALLRSVSPVHIQYLKNMGVGASASVSLVRDGALWGLIACHHRSPRHIGYEDREMCRRVAIALDQAIDRLEEENSQREALRLTRAREQLLPLIAAEDRVGPGLRARREEIRRLLSADGLCLVLDGELDCTGVTPPEPIVRDLARWLTHDGSRALFATDQLASLFPAAANWSACAAGLLGCVVMRAPVTALIWFRAEQLETVNWAGNPHEAAEPGTALGQLNPRKSFEVWAETVRGRSKAWTPNEQEAARRFGAGLFEVARLKSLAESNLQLSGEVAEKDLLMREMHHRVQNSLQLVTAMLMTQERELSDESARAQLALARDRVLSVALLHRRLWRSEDVENISLGEFFSELVEGLLRTWHDDWRGQLTMAVEPIQLPANEALMTALIVSELLTNAVKHAYCGNVGPIQLTVCKQDDDRLAIEVADQGVGKVNADSGDGFGSRLIEQLVSRIHAELRVASKNPGTCVTLLVPLRHADG